MRRQRIIRALLFAAVIAAGLLVAASVLARPGGGQSFSGGGAGGGSSSSGHGIGDAIVGFIIGIIWDLLPWPIKALIIGIFFISYVVAAIRKRMHPPDWDSGSGQGGSGQGP